MTTETFISPSDHSQKTPTLETYLIAGGFFFILIATVLLFFYLLKPQPVPFVAGQAPMTAQQTPIQLDISGDRALPIIITSGGVEWTLTPRAGYQIGARVLGNKRYMDWQSPVVPRDLALGWGEMSDPAVDEWINWRQSKRWYYYNWNGDSPYQGRTIRNQSANVHIIPATDYLATALAEVKKGEIVYLNGRLVDIRVHLNGREMSARTSLTRHDSGGGACEILYVEQLIIDGRLIE